MYRLIEQDVIDNNVKFVYRISKLPDYSLHKIKFIKVNKYKKIIDIIKVIIDKQNELYNILNK